MQNKNKTNNIQSEDNISEIPSCCIIGSTTLLIQCAEILQQQGFNILNIFSNDAHIQQWSKSMDIACFAVTDEIAFVLQENPCDWLFSVVNPHILKQDILSIPLKGSINYHNSLLPTYAGAHATVWAIMNRESTHGISWHFMESTIDSGDLLVQQSIIITAEETSLTLNAKCYDAAISAFHQLLENIGENDLKPIYQDPTARSYYASNKRPLQASVISWQQSAADIHADFRALTFGSPYPNQLGMLKILIADQVYAVAKLKLLNQISDSAQGSITYVGNSSFEVATSDNVVSIDRLFDMQGNEVAIETLSDQLICGDQLPKINKDVADEITDFHSVICHNESYWVRQLSSIKVVAPPFVQQKFDTISKGRQSKNRAVIRIALPSVLNDLASRNTEHLIIAFSTYLARLSNEPEFSLAYQCNENDWYSIFSRQIPLNLTIDVDNSFTTIAEQLRLVLKANSEHATFLSDIIFRYPELNKQPAEHDVTNIPILIACVDHLEKFDVEQHFALALVIDNEAKECALSFNTDVLNQDDSVRLADMFSTFLQGLEGHFDIPVWNIPLLADVELSRLTAQRNNVDGSEVPDRCVHQIFEDWALQTPHAIAISSELEQISYSELNLRANGLALTLIDAGITAEKIVGICLARTPNLIISILAILKAGGAYLPMDPEYPEERLAFLVADAKPDIVITDTAASDKIKNLDTTLLLLDSQTAMPTSPVVNPEVVCSASDLAYLIYTSGTTGTPKGVMIEQAGFVNAITHLTRFFDLKSGDRVAHILSFSFDAATAHLFEALCSGATSVLIRSDRPDEWYDLGGILRDQQISHLSIPPSLLASIGEQRLPALKVLGLGAEKCPPQLADKWAKVCRVVHNYGPTECSIVSTTTDHICDSTKAIIGEPIPNIQVYILDQQQQPTPRGIVGELYLGGIGVARGYLNQTVLTQQAFIPDPFDSCNNSRIYRTGDLAYYLPDGKIAFVGRTDGQVKIRGFRIELGEVESALCALDVVDQAVAIIKELPSGASQLICFVVANAQNRKSEDELRDKMAHSIPRHLVPDKIVLLDALPTTSHGKVDRSRLSDASLMLQTDRPDYHPPSTLIEKCIADIWSEILKVDNIGLEDNFFSLGGDSLTAATSCAKIEATIGRSTPFTALFEHSTVKELAVNISQLDGNQQNSPPAIEF